MNAAKNHQSPSHEEISTYAYFLWEADGRVHGRDVEYWLQAKAHLTAHRAYEAGLLQKPEKIAAQKTQAIVAPLNISPKASKSSRRQSRIVPERAYA